MKTLKAIWSAVSLPLILIGCSKSDVPPAASAAPASSAVASASAASVAASASEASVKKRLTAKDGNYELAELIAYVMVDHPAGWAGATNGLVSRDYNEFKEYVREIKFVGMADGPRLQPSTATLRGFKAYTGTTGLMIRGQRAIVENVEDDYKWRVFFGGPEVAATSIELSADKTVVIQEGKGNGAAYFREAGFTLIPIACDAMGYGNNNAVYAASFPGKFPALLSISASTGSGGQSMSYALFLSGMSWRDTPGFGQKDSGLAEMGDCRINPEE